VISVSFSDATGEFVGPANWGALSGTSHVEKRTGVILSTRDLAADTNDLKASNTYEFRATSDRLPAPTIAIIYPRRVTCEPTDEDWPALAAKGWTREKLGRLHRLEYYTNREIVIAPVLENTGEDSPTLFEKAMTRLADLQQYLAPLAEGEPSRKIPAPPEGVAGFVGLGLDEARQRSIELSADRPQDVALITALYHFYESRR
jgi:hypothetical protein